MDVGVVEALLGELGQRGVRTLELGGGGEPLQHPHMAGLLRRFAGEAFRIGLITNGYALVNDPSLVDPLLRCADWVRFSIDSVSEESFRTIHGRPDLSYRRLRTVIGEMLDQVRSPARGDTHPKIGLKYLIQAGNEHEVERAIDEALDLRAHYVQFKFLEDHPRAIGDDRQAVTSRLLDRIRRLPPGSLSVDILPGYGGPRRIERCRMSVLHPLVDWDGEIYMCAFFHHRRERHSLGNVRHGGFFHHWGTATHRRRIREVDPLQCVPNCPLLRYNPVVDFIVRESFRFSYI